MVLRFVNGAEKKCTPPVEQKAFRNGVPVGWYVSFRMQGVTDSTEVDTLFSEENISELVFSNEDGIELISLSGYKKVASCSIRYAEDAASIVTEVQLTKGE